jgi:Rrf2 family protein
MKYGPPRGMRDFYPEEMKRRTWLFNLWRRAALQHGFEEYDAPVVETEELLTRKSGEEIVHQIYTFKDKSGRALALRPEMTPSLARMIIARQNTLSFPVRWFSIPQCFRYERMTRGRKREHFQWNMDIIGEESVIAEAEILSTAITALKGAGLVRSKRGVGGGYLLARPVDEIRLSEIVSAVEGPIVAGDFGDPHQDGACDHEGQCVLLAIWAAVGEHMRELLDSFTLADIASMAQGEKPWPD